VSRRPGPVARLLIGVVAILAVAGLSTVASLPAPPPASQPAAEVPDVVLPPPPAREWPGEPWTRNGERVPTTVMSLRLGPGHCGWDDAVFLTFHRQIGAPVRMLTDALQYIRDPRERFETLGPFEPSVARPADAVFTGYLYGPIELWLSPSVGADAVFVRRADIGPGDVWERWPRAPDPPGCS
jgi:hypothetical protein